MFTSLLFLILVQQLTDLNYQIVMICTCKTRSDKKTKHGNLRFKHPGKHLKVGHHPPTSETPFEWHLACGQMVARHLMAARICHLNMGKKMAYAPLISYLFVRPACSIQIFISLFICLSLSLSSVYIKVCFSTSVVARRLSNLA